MSVLIHDNADKVPPPTPGRHPLTPISGADWHPRGGVRLPPQAWLLITVLCGGIVAWLLWRLDAALREFWARYWWLGEGLLLLLTLSLAGVIVAAVVGGVQWGRATIAQRRLYRTRLGTAADIMTVIGTDQATAEAPHIELEKAGQPFKQHPTLSTLSVPKAEAAPKVLTVSEDAPAQLLAPESGVGILEDWRRRGWIDRSGESLVAGIAADGKPRLIDLSTCGYIAVGGRTRSGKTSTVRSWLCQGAIMGWQFVICDKHANKPDGLLATVQPLERAFALPPARTPEEYAQRIRDVDALGRERLRVGGFHRPLWLVLDEYTNMIVRGELPDAVLDILLSIAIEYAGVNIHGIIIGQGWSGNMVGKERGASQRRAMTHRMIHPCDPAEAAFLLPSGYQRMVSNIQRGQAIFFGDEAPEVLRIPYMGPDEVTWAAQQIPEAVHPLMLPTPLPTGAPARTRPDVDELPAHMHSASPRAQIAWLAANTSLSTRDIRERLACDYNLVVEVVAKVRGPRGHLLRSRLGGS